jgi:hypothetical protein
VTPVESVDTDPVPATATGTKLNPPDEAISATGPIYPVRTTLVLLQDVVFPASGGGAETRLPAGTLVRTAGTYIENGVCDLWPVYASPLRLWGAVSLTNECSPPHQQAPHRGTLGPCSIMRELKGAVRATRRSGDANREVMTEASVAVRGSTSVFAPRLRVPRA